MQQNELPEGWAWTTIEEVCHSPQYGWTTSAASEGKIKLLRTTDISSGKINWDSVPFCEKEPEIIDKYLLKDGDIVISRAGSVGYSHLIKNTERSVFASYLIRFRPLINEQYVAYFLKSPSYWDSISEKSLGIAVPNINASKLKQIEIPLPPLPEQHRIVTAIEALFSRLGATNERLDRVPGIMKSFRQAVLAAACDGRLTEDWRREQKDLPDARELLEQIYREREKTAKTSNKKLKSVKSLSDDEIAELPSLPKGWSWKKLGELIEHIQAGKSIKCNERPPASNEIGIIKVSSVSWGEFNPSESKTCYDNRSFNEAYIIHEGDFLFSRANTIELIGACVIAKSKYENLMLSDKILRLEFIDSLNKFYTLYYLRSVNGRKEIESLATGNQESMKNIAQDKIKQIVIPIPPLLEQQEIVRRVDALFAFADSIEAKVAVAREKTEKLRQSVLAKAFSGELVPTEAELARQEGRSYESAEVLLKRIKGEGKSGKK